MGGGGATAGWVRSLRQLVQVVFVRGRQESQDAEGTRLVIERWTPERGLRRVERDSRCSIAVPERAAERGGRRSEVGIRSGTEAVRSADADSGCSISRLFKGELVAEVR